MAAWLIILVSVELRRVKKHVIPGFMCSVLHVIIDERQQDIQLGFGIIHHCPICLLVTSA